MFPQSSAASVKVDEDASVKKSAEEAPVEVTNSASSSPSVVNVAIDWDTHPLPEHWSRKVDKKSNKVILFVLFISRTHDVLYSHG